MKNCPFCGENEAKYEIDKDDFRDTKRYVRCGNCGSRGEDCSTKEQAINAWNERKDAK